MAKKPVTLDATGHRKFGIRDSVAYAAGDLGCNMSFALKGTMSIFWTQFMGMDLWYALLLIVVQVWDAINDPLIGSIIDSDRHAYKRNKFLTYIWAGSIGLIVGGACCFLPFPNAPVWAKAIIFIAGYVVWDAFYTVANVPYGSLLSLISDDVKDRASLSAWRSVGSIFGNMLPMVILPFIIYDANNNLIGERVFFAALIMGALGFVCFQFMIRNTEIRVDTAVTLNEEQPKFNVFKAFGNFMKNRPAVGATIAAMGMFLGMQSATTANTIMFATHFGQASLSGLVMMVGFLPMFIFMPFATKLVKKYGKKEVASIGSIVGLIGSAILCVFPVCPKNIQLIIYMIGLVFFGLGMGFYNCVSWAMMGDAIDYNEWKFGKREESVVYALHSFFRKLAQGVGPAAVIAIMGTPLIGYVSALGTIGQSAATAKNMCWLVAILYAFSAVCQFVGIALVYNIDKKTLAKMNAELEARRASEMNAK